MCIDIPGTLAKAVCMLPLRRPCSTKHTTGSRSHGHSAKPHPTPRRYLASQAPGGMLTAGRHLKPCTRGHKTGWAPSPAAHAHMRPVLVPSRSIRWYCCIIQCTIFEWIIHSTKYQIVRKLRNVMYEYCLCAHHQRSAVTSCCQRPLASSSTSRHSIS